MLYPVGSRKNLRAARSASTSPAGGAGLWLPLQLKPFPSASPLSPCASKLRSQLRIPRQPLRRFKISRISIWRPGQAQKKRPHTSGVRGRFYFVPRRPTGPAPWLAISR